MTIDHRHAADSFTAPVPRSDGQLGRRLFSASGNGRSDYWRVALNEFDSEPFHGVGAGNYDPDYYRLRRTTDAIEQPHSLELQTLAELGLVGLALLLAFLGGVGWAAVRAHRIAPAAAAGPFAALVTYLVHSPLDWDWQMPAVTLGANISRYHSRWSSSATLPGFSPLSTRPILFSTT